MPSPTEHDRDGYEASELARGLPEARAEETAARTVREHRRLEGRTPNRTTQGTGNPNVPLAGAREGRARQSREGAGYSGALEAESIRVRPPN